MVTYTTTYSLAKPSVAGDEDVWGGYLNGNFDTLENLLKGTTALTAINVTGNITVGGTVDGVDIAARDAVLTSTTTTANAALPKAGGTMTGAITFATGQTFDGRDVSADGAKLDGIEAGATADQTAAEIKTAYESNANTNAYTDAEKTKLAGIETGATADQTASEILTLIKTVDGAGSGLDADTLDGISSASFLRSDAADTMTGALTIDTTGRALLITGTGTVDSSDVSIYLGNSPSSYGFDITYEGSGSGSANAFVITSTNLGTPKELIRANQDGIVQLVQSGTTIAGNQVWHAGNDGSGSGLDADLWDGNQFSSYLNQAVLTTSAPTFANMYVGDNIYHTGDTDTRILFGTNTITMQTGGSSEITVDATGVRLGDTGNGYFQPVSGDFGSIQVDGGAHSGWEGYSIGGRSVFMHDNSTNSGIYNDVNNQWLFRATHAGNAELYYAGASKLDTLSNGVSINGNLYTDGSNAEDWDALSGTAVTCNVDNAGAFSLTMTGNTTFTFSGADANWSMGFVLQLTGNGGTVTWPASVDWAGGTAPDAPASGETDIYVFWTRDGGTTWYGVLSVDAAA